MTIYIRTAKGNEVALDPSSGLPRKLRTLLIGIDGRTSVGAYIKGLSSFGDVDALLGSLRDAGLIEPLAAARQGSNRGTNVEHTTASQSESWSDTTADYSAVKEAGIARASAFTKIGNAFRRSHASESISGQEELTSAPPFMPSYAPVLRPAPLADLQPGRVGTYAPSKAGSSSSTAQYQLSNAISLMSDFVTQHLPADSLEIVLMLEGLGSVEQVLASLKGYEALVAPVGEPARGHLAELRGVLTRF